MRYAEALARTSVHSMFSPFKTLEFRAVMEGLGDDAGYILDVGCGSGTQTFAMRKRGDAIQGFDPSRQAIGLANEVLATLGLGTVSFYPSTIETEFRSGEFDSVVMICVLEHLQDSVQALKMAHENLTADGKLVLTCDSLCGVDPRMKKRHMDDHCVQRYFTRGSLFDAMREAGFRRIKTRYLFRSRFARWLFRRCVYRGFKLPKIAYFPVLALLWISEALTFSGEGMFVYCEAHKKDVVK